MAKSKLTKNVYECKIVNISKIINETPLQEIIPSAIQQLDIRDDNYLLGFNKKITKRTIKTGYGNDTHIGTDDIYKLYFSNNILVTLDKNFSSSDGAHWPTEYASIKFSNYKIGEFANNDKLITPIKYLSMDIKENEEGDIYTLKMDGNKQIIINQVGTGDKYYPHGFIKLNFNIDKLKK